ncbi:MlaD family protein [Alphaproteobacteria bacterium]|nr:MlaD family protein [Alphaproteobacteria bacterium]
MNKRSSDFTAGLFVLCGVFLIATMFVLIRGQFEKQDEYHTYFNNVAGLKKGAVVVYEGYRIGSVDDITPQRNSSGMRFKIEMGVESGWTIPSGSRAQVASLSLLSSQVIKISAGLGEPLVPGSEILASKAGNIMSDLTRSADKLTNIAESSLKPLLETFANVLDNEGRQALSGISGISVEVQDTAPKILDNIEKVSENLKEASSSIATIFNQETQVDLKKTVKAMSSATETLEDVVDNVSAITSNDNREAFNSILKRIQNASEALEISSEETLQGMRSVRRLLNDSNMDTVSAFIKSAEGMRSELMDTAVTIRVAASNISELSDMSDNHIEVFLQRLENTALNLEEMTAQLRDDPSIIIRGTE